MGLAPTTTTASTYSGLKLAASSQKGTNTLSNSAIFGRSPKLAQSIA
jgi:hypothetical protein